MLKWIETTGRSEEDAISAALFQLGLDRDDVSIEVIERAKSGFLGFGGNPAKVRVSYEEEDGRPVPKKDLLEEEPVPASVPVQERKAEPAPVQAEETVLSAPAREKAEPAQAVEEETILAAKPGMSAPRAPRPQRERREPRRPRREERLQEGDEVLMEAPAKPAAPSQPLQLTPAAQDDQKAAQIRTFLTGLLEHLHVLAEPDVYTTQEGGYQVILQGENLGALIGRRGETLDAIQQLTSYSVNRGQSKRVRIHVDAEGYRAKREESLQRLARKVAGKVVKYRRNVMLEPMNAYERHVIHTALQDYPDVTTYSTGTEPNRRTVVAYSKGEHRA